MFKHKSSKKNSQEDNSGIISIVCGIIFVIFIFFILLLNAFWTDRNLDYLLTLIKGSLVNCPFWLSAIISICGNGAVFVFNIIMELVRLVKG